MSETKEAPKRKRPTDSGLNCADLDWLLNQSASEVGARSNLGSVVASLERGGASMGLPETDLYNDRQMGWCAGKGPVERLRELEPVWRALTLETQRVLIAHYCAKPAGIDEQAWTSAVGALGQLVGAAVWLVTDEQRARLLDVCTNRGKQGRKQTIQAALKRADAAVREAHEAWYAAMEGARGTTPTPTAA